MSYINVASVNSVEYDIYSKALNDGTNELSAANAKTAYDKLGTTAFTTSTDTVMGCIGADGLGYVPTGASKTLSATQALNAQKNGLVLAQGSTSGAPAPDSSIGFVTYKTVTVS